MTIPQIKKTALSLAVIFVGIPLTTTYHLYLSGEVKGWAELWTRLPVELNHSTFTAFWACVGWILLKSPFAGKITELLSSTTTDSGAKQDISIKITEPAEEPKKP